MSVVVPKVNLEGLPVAYSYVRFSTAKQELGDSLRRQVSMAEKYAKENALYLSEDRFSDLGVSGFKSKNVKTGALAAFIGAVKNGTIVPGSYLLIEQFDRLSRAEITVAFRLLLDLVDAGVIVVTLVDERVWDRVTVEDVANVLTSIILMSRAHEESKAKSKRLRDAWGEKKDSAADIKRDADKVPLDDIRNIVTRECPRWLKVNEANNGFDVLADKVESIEKVFAMRGGGYGVVSIVRRANQESWPVPGKGDTWHTSTVGRLLKNRALLGEYQPHTVYQEPTPGKAKDAEQDGKRRPVGDPIKGFYPCVLDPKVFDKAAAAADRKGPFPGRRDASLKNWLQGLLRCTCGASFVRKNKNSLAQPGYARYYCTGRNRGVTECPGAKASELENAVIAVVSDVAPAHFDGSRQVEVLQAKCDVLEVKVSAAKTTVSRFVEAIAHTGGNIAALSKSLKEAAADLEEKEQALALARAQISDLAGSDSVFDDIMKAVRSVDSLDARAALRENLSRVIEKVVVHQADGYIEVHVRGSLGPPITRPLRPFDLAIPGLTITEGGTRSYPPPGAIDET